MSGAAQGTGGPSWQRVLLGPRPLIGLVMIYAGSRALGLVREIGFAYYFGTTRSADRFAAVFAIASVAGILVGEASYASTLRSIRNATGDHAAAVGAALGASVRVALVSGVLFAAVAPPAAYLLLGGGNVTPLVPLSLAFAVSVGALVVTSTCYALLTHERRFAAQGALQTLYSAGAVVALGTFLISAVQARPLAVAIGWAAGNVVAMLAALHLTGVQIRRARWDHSLAFFRVGLPLSLAYFLFGVQTYIAQALAARLGTGRVAALNYADRLFLLPVGFVLAVLGPVVLGSASSAHRNPSSDPAGVVQEQLRLLTRLIVPCSLLFAALAPLLMRLIYGYGAFDAASLAQTRSALDGLTAGVVPVSFVIVGLRAMQATLPFRTLVALAFGSLIAYVAIAIPSSQAFGLVGITGAIGATALAVFAGQILMLARKFPASWRGVTTRLVFIPAAAVTAGTALVVVLDRSKVIGEHARFVSLLVAFMLSLVWVFVVTRRP